MKKLFLTLVICFSLGYVSHATSADASAAAGPAIEAAQAALGSSVGSFSITHQGKVLASLALAAIYLSKEAASSAQEGGKQGLPKYFRPIAEFVSLGLPILGIRQAFRSPDNNSILLGALSFAPGAYLFRNKAMDLAKIAALASFVHLYEPIINNLRDYGPFK